MRNLLAILLLTLALPAAAAERPGNLQPAPADLPPPPDFSLDPALEPQITIIQRGTDTVEETRVSGRLVMIKVTPATGPSYYLIDGHMILQDSLDFGVRPPMWVIHSW